jgi:SAM-dependent methyltransferase
MRDFVDMKCRFDNLPLTEVFLDLGFTPPANSFLTEPQLNEPEIYYPLRLYVSDRTFLVQVDEYYKAREIFSEQYAYFSSYSSSWLRHARSYADMAVERFALKQKDSLVIEVGSNDGYLLQYFADRGIQVLGIEPSANVAAAAQNRGIRTRVEFFGLEAAAALCQADLQPDLLIGNNVLAHVPNINDFVAGVKLALKASGTATFEFPHLLRLVEGNEFDTIYHEHFWYFSLTALIPVFHKHQLAIFDVEEIPTHGGSLRIYVKHEQNATDGPSPAVMDLVTREESAGIREIDYYRRFQTKVDRAKCNLLGFLVEQKSLGKHVVGYGAAAKGNTLLNYCGIKRDMVEFVVDLSPHKQGKYLPGSHIPVVTEARIRESRPDYIVILPWNIRMEIMNQLAYVREWGAKFVVAIPELQIV